MDASILAPRHSIAALALVAACGGHARDRTTPADHRQPVAAPETAATPPTAAADPSAAADHPQPAATPPTAAAGPGAPTAPAPTARPAADLFAAGARSTFRVTDVVLPSGKTLPYQRAGGALSCKVTATWPTGDVVVSQVDCAQPGYPLPAHFPPAGYWVTNGDSVWHFDRDPRADIAADAARFLDPSRAVTSSHPTARTWTVKVGAASVQYRSELVKRGALRGWNGAFADSAWCTRVGPPPDAAGDRWEACFDAAGTLVAGTWQGAGLSVVAGYDK